MPRGPSILGWSCPATGAPCRCSPALLFSARGRRSPFRLREMSERPQYSLLVVSDPFPARRETWVGSIGGTLVGEPWCAIKAGCPCRGCAVFLSVGRAKHQVPSASLLAPVLLPVSLPLPLLFPGLLLARPLQVTPSTGLALLTLHTVTMWTWRGDSGRKSTLWSRKLFEAVKAFRSLPWSGHCRSGWGRSGANAGSRAQWRLIVPAWLAGTRRTSRSCMPGCCVRRRGTPLGCGPHQPFTLHLCTRGPCVVGTRLGHYRFSFFSSSHLCAPA